MTQVKQVNELTKNDFNKSVAHSKVKRGFFSYAEYCAMLSQKSDLQLKISELTADNVNRYIADNKLNTESLVLFIRESAVVFMLEVNKKVIYKFNSNVFYADKFIADNKNWQVITADNINVITRNRDSNVDKIGASYGFNIK